MKQPITFIGFRFPFTLFCLLIFNQVIGQEYFWASAAGGGGNDATELIVRDKTGNIYASGYFYSPACIFQTDTLYCHGNNDSFIVKYNPAGQEIWVRQLGLRENVAGAPETISGMVFDSLDETLLVTGTFYRALILPDTIIYGNHLDVFVLKMDLDGNVLWARTGGGEHEDVSMGITCDEQENVYISGSNAFEATFGNTTIPRGGFLAKYNKSGELIWAKNKFRYYEYSSDPIYTEAPPIHLTFSNQHLMVYGSILNDSLVVDTITLAGIWGFNSSYLASFDPEGQIEWLTKVGGVPYNDRGKGPIARDPDGNFYLTGSFEVIGIYGNDTLTTSGKNINDIFLTKVAPDGSFLWATQGFSNSFAGGHYSLCDEDGNVYVVGVYSDSVTFGGQTLVSHTEMDLFLVSYTSDGLFRGLFSFINTGVKCLAFDLAGNLVLGGVFEDALELGSTTLISHGLYDSFVAKCSPITSTKESPSGPYNKLLIYANPTTGKCNITIPDEFKHEKELTLYIYDSQGRLVQQAAIKEAEGTYRLDIRAQAAGIYQAVLSNGSKQYSGKIVLAKNH